MWIRTQDKKQILTKITKLSVSKNFGGKSKASLLAEYGNSTIFGNHQVTIGQYLTEAEALEELSNIQKFLDNKTTEVYQVK